MIDERDKRETAEERKARRGGERPGQPSDSILKKLRYPEKSEYRVKYEDDALVVVSED